MRSEDKTLLADKINSLQDVYGKQKITAAAFLIWWETLKEFDHNDVFTCLGYWAANNSRPPLPNDVWKACNEKRTEAIEVKAARERASNRAPIPHDFHPTEYGRMILKACYEILGRKREPEGRHEWARKIIDMDAGGQYVPFITLKIARDRMKEVE